MPDGTATPDPQYCLLAINHWSTCMSKAEWASWAQAIGTVLAIGGTILAVYLQLRAQRRREIQLGDLRHFRRLSMARHATARLVTVAKEMEWAMMSEVISMCPNTTAVEYHVLVDALATRLGQFDVLTEGFIALEEIHTWAKVLVPLMEQHERFVVDGVDSPEWARIRAYAKATAKLVVEASDRFSAVIKENRRAYNESYGVEPTELAT